MQYLHIEQEIKLFEGLFFVISSHLVLALERTKSRNHSTCIVKSIGFDQLMASKDTETLILAFTSKTGQSVAHTRHRIF